MRILWPAMLAGLAITLANVGVVHARPVYKKALADHFGPFLPKQLNDCRTCHALIKPGDKEDPGDKHRNASGARLKEIKRELTKAGKKTDITSRIEAIAEEDSDGDGVSNLRETL